MKKLFSAFICATLVMFAVPFIACGNVTEKITVYAPDGAPALALAELMHEEKNFGKDVEYHITDSSEIASHVTYKDNSKNADLCILPVNAASKLLGSGEKYKALGAVTHGNLFLLSNTEKQIITSENFAESVSTAKIGVVNLPAFPGAVTKLLLEKYGVSGSVTLSNIAATAVNGNDAQYDYFVVPEPAASTRIGVTSLNLKTVGSLQELYNGSEGYPQAVLVAKADFIENNSKFIADFKSALLSSADWILNEKVTSETILQAIKKHYADPENTAPAFNAKNLTKSVIKNCAVKFVDVSDCSSEIKEFLKQLKAAGDETAAEVSDSFFAFSK